MKRGGGAGRQPFIVLTGLSGSGKSQAIRALEDLGYFCVDNLPTTLIPTLAKLSLRAGGDIEKVAIVVDVREGEFLSSFPKIFRKLRAMPRLNPVLIFLEATNVALVRRFSETRRPHPLAPGRSVSEGIREERSRMNVIRAMAELGAGYPEVVDLLRKLDDRQALDCPVSANTLPALVSLEHNGHLEESDSTRLAPPGAAFWSAIGLDGRTVRSRGAHAAGAHADDDSRGARGRARSHLHASRFRLRRRGPAACQRRSGSTPRSAQHMDGIGGV